MRQTLFFIPHEMLGIPLFGIGWLLVLWILFAIAWMTWLVRKHGWNADTIGLLPFLVIVAVSIAFLIPRFEVRGPDGEYLGLPIRGYGTFVLAGFTAGLGLAVHRASKRGIGPETIFSLAVWMFIAAFIGARLFFVIEYWEEDFNLPTWRATIGKIVQIAEGGLVVYGALLAGLPALFLFCRKNRIPPLLLGDIVAPCLALGLALGRLGCLMNGCCYGGICEHGPIGIQFPKFNSVAQKTMSPPYLHQLKSGRLHGFILGSNAQHEPFVQSVVAGGPAANAGLKAGERIVAINGEATPDIEAATKALALAGPQVEVATESGGSIAWTIGALPEQSLAVHPIQIYSAVNAMLLCLVVLFGEPFMRRTGEVLAWTLTLYPPLRFVEEIIRVDEMGQFGTNLSISQLISLVLLVGAAALWMFILRNEPVKRVENFEPKEHLSVA